MLKKFSFKQAKLKRSYKVIIDLVHIKYSGIRCESTDINILYRYKGHLHVFTKRECYKTLVKPLTELIARHSFDFHRTVLTHTIDTIHE